MIGTGPRISERVMLKRDRFFAVSARDGSMRPEEFSGDGVWHGDTRILSRCRVLVDGVEPAPVRWQADDSSATFELRAGRVRVTRERFLDGGLHERITIHNEGQATLQATLDVELTSDGAAMLGIRGAVPALAHPVAGPPMTERHQLDLKPGDEVSVMVGGAASDFDAGLRAARATYTDWAAECMAVRTDNPGLNQLLEQAIDDVRMLCDRYDTGLYPTAGLPWFAVPFGRDALITALMLLPVNPAIARGVLRYLARHQGTRIDPDSEEQPGKILHEVRDGEAVAGGYWPRILYGTVDATPLFMCALSEAERWTHDQTFTDELWPAAEAALEWCIRHGDADGDGYIEYGGGRARNQGWKDSDDSLTNIDGSDALRPAALCEVQAYLHRGLLGMSSRRPELERRAAELRRSFNRDFWMPDQGFFAQALDGAKRQVRAITSNPGHCLWMRAIDEEKAAPVVQRLMSADMFSGWGIRTLSDRAVNYDPCSYHNGSVWPFDSGVAIAGMREYGFGAEAERAARALVEAALELPMRRPPELFCGDPRQPGAPPREYWNTCTPQLWSAAAMFACVSAILGLEADPRRKVLRIAPLETGLWNWIEVKGLHFAGHRIDFGVRGHEVKLGALPRGVTIS